MPEPSLNLSLDDLTDETSALERAQGKVEDLMGQPILRQARTLTLDADGQRDLVIPAWPLHDVESVEVDGEPVEVEWSEAGWLRRADGRRWPSGPRTVEVEVDAGWDEAPKTLVDVILSVAKRGIDNPNGYQTENIAGYSYRIGGAPGAVLSTQEREDVARYAIRR